MKISMTKAIVLFFLTLALIPAISFSAMKWRSFVFTAPEEVAASPGQEVLINASVLNTGWWWLHNFSVTLEGLPADFEYTIKPDHWDEFRITRDWNPQQGVFKIPEPVLISIKVPINAAGLYTVTLKGQENYSPYKFSNTTTFVLKIIGEPQLSVSDISVPPVVYENETFNVSFDITNRGNAETVANATLNMPANWSVDFKNKVDIIEPNSTKTFTFAVTPTVSSGAISTYVEYLYGKTIYNTTKEGPVVSPLPKAVTQPTGVTVPKLSDIFERYSPVLITIIAVIVIVIAWILWSMYTMYGKRKKPETMKKQVEIATLPNPTTEVNQTSSDNLV